MSRHGRPSIVLVAHFCPFPPTHGNRRRLLTLIRWLKGRGFALTFVLQPMDVEDPRGLAQLEAEVDRLEIVPAPSGDWGPRSLRLAARVARGVLPRRVAAGLREYVIRQRTSGREVEETWSADGIGGDRHIDRWCWPATSRRVNRAVRRDRPIAVIAEYALLSKCFEAIAPPTLRVIDTHEVFFRNPERFQVEGLSAPFICSPESEVQALDRADVLIAIQANDARALRARLPAKHVITVSHVSPDGHGREAGAIRRGAVLYVASSNPFNAHALREFLAHAWPSIVTRVPGATLRVVGSVPVPPGAEARGVVAVGRVSDEDLAREYRAAHVVVNPQVAGTGLKIKCVEALAAGCPLVTRPAGADGLEEGAGTAFLVAEDWPTFAGHVVTLLTDETARGRLEDGARGFAATRFSADRTFAELDRVLRG